MILAIISSVSAVKFTPAELHINATTNITANYSIQVFYDNTSTTNFTLYNLTFTPIQGFTFSKLHNLSYLQTKQLNFTATFSSRQQSTFIPKLTFYYMINITKEPETYIITTTDTGFSQNSLDLSVNDTITMKNQGTQDHEITIIGNDTLTVPEDSEINITLRQVNNYTIIHELSSTGLSVKARTNIMQTPARDPNLDLPYNIIVNAGLPPTNYTYEFIRPKEKINYNEQSSGLIYIRPEEKIYNLKLESDSWITFNSNDQDISTDTSIGFSIRPANMTKTEETGKSYNKQIRITGENIREKVINFSIYVNPHNFSESAEGKIYVEKPVGPEEVEKYCRDLYGDDVAEWEGECDGFVVIKNNTVYEDRPRPIDVNPGTVEEALTGYDRLSGDVDTLKTRTEDSTKECKDAKEQSQQTNREFREFKNQTNEVLGEIKDYMQAKSRDNNWLFWGFVLICTIVLGIYGYHKVKEYLANKEVDDLGLAG